MKHPLFCVYFLTCFLFSYSAVIQVFPLATPITGENLIRRGQYLSNNSNFDVSIFYEESLFHLVLRLTKNPTPIYSLDVMPQILGKGRRVVPDSKGPIWNRNENEEFIYIDGTFDLLQLNEFHCDESENNQMCDYSFNFLASDLGGAINLILNGKFKVHLYVVVTF